MKRGLWLLPLVFPVVTTLAQSADFDWPQWQGPDRNAISREKGLLQEWPQDGPPLAWKTSGLGGGDSAPSVAAGKIYGMSIRGDKEVVWALSEKDGKEIWVMPISKAYQQARPQSREGSGCTPTVDGERLYVLSMAGELSCLQAGDGKILWQNRAKEEFSGTIPPWSYRESPLVDGDKVICTPGGSGATLVAFNKVTGKLLWKSDVPGQPQAAYSSAIAIDFEGQHQIVQLTQKALVGVAATDGKFLWQYDRAASKSGINCSTPVHQDDHIFASSAYGNGGGLVKLIKDGNGGTRAEEVYFTKSMQNHHGGMIYLDGCLYGANGGNEGGYLLCLDFKTGKIYWDERNGKSKVAKGAIALADGRLYYRTEKGTVLLIEPSKEKYIEKGRFEQPNRTKSPAWAHPVIANGKLYIRDQDVLYCYDVKAK